MRIGRLVLSLLVLLALPTMSPAWAKGKGGQPIQDTAQIAGAPEDTVQLVRTSEDDGEDVNEDEDQGEHETPIIPSRLNVVLPDAPIPNLSVIPVVTF